MTRCLYMSHMVKGISFYYTRKFISWLYVIKAVMHNKEPSFNDIIIRRRINNDFVSLVESRTIVMP